MSFFEKLFGKGGGDKVAELPAVARPVLVNISLRDNEAIAQSNYRIDAIQRYCAQRREEGRQIDPGKMDDFRKELRERTAYLLSKEQITFDQADAIIRSIEDGGK